MKNVFKVLKENPVIFDLLFLLVSIISVHLFYVLFVNPISVAELQVAISAGEVPARTFWLVIKDFEQELCLIFGVWCLLLLANRYQLKNQDNQLIALDFLSLEEAETNLQDIQKNVEEADQLDVHGYLLPGIKVFLNSIRVNPSLEQARQDVAEFYELTEETLDARLNLVNYILWAIPSIGFLGTVRGIGQALANVDEALSGNISGVALNLGIAFNSTFVAILISVFLTFVSMSLRGREADRLVRCKTYINESLSKRAS